MLATVGFGVTGILFIVFALTIRSLAGTKLKRILDRYALAYVLVACAFIFWSIASASGTHGILGFSVVVGDILLFIATLLLAGILLEGNANRKRWLYGAAIIGIALLVVRTVFFYPEPYMVNQVLFFISQRLVSFTLSSVFLFIWLPANLQIAHLVTRKAQSIASIYKFLYAAATLSAVIFLLSKAPLTLVLSFTAISLSFLLLIISSKYIKVIEEGRHGEQRSGTQ